MAVPLAFLLTFRTYGTWLHGDERGSVDREHNAPGTEYLPSNPARVRYEQRALAADAFLLDAAHRRTVEAALIDECAYREWELICCSVRSNHVHIVVGSADERPEEMARRLKARATRWLRERHGVSRAQPVWARRAGSRRWLWSREQINAAKVYVAEQQDGPR